MTPETINMIDNFLNRSGFNFSLSQVSEITGATMKDLTNWRTRSLLPFPAEKIGERYYVTRDGFVAIGVMAELAWLIGPDNASAVANAIWETFFARSPHGLDIEEFRDTVVYFRKTVAQRADITEKPRFPSESEDIWQKVSGFPLMTQTADQLAAQPIPNSTTVILPLGLLVCQWALRFETEIS